MSEFSNLFLENTSQNYLKVGQSAYPKNSADHSQYEDCRDIDGSNLADKKKMFQFLNTFFLAVIPVV